MNCNLYRPLFAGLYIHSVSAIVQATTTQSQDPTEVAARQERLAEERKVYENLKQELWRWSVGVTALCFAGTIALFSRVGLPILALPKIDVLM